MTEQCDTGRRILYLASASPRRRELLAQVGIEFELAAAQVDEGRRGRETAADYVRRLALAKARAASRSVDLARGIVLAADTAVVIDDRILGKPVGEADAVRMLGALSGRSHEVYTGIVALDETREAFALSRSAVRFREISPAEAAAYWQTGEPRDKAGGYAIQGIGAIFVAELRGSYSGVMGLPLFETACTLTSFGYRFLGPGED
jgi:septum formation protein